MAIFDFLRRRDEQTSNSEQTSTQPQEATDVLLQSLLKGEKITRKEAMTIPAVSAAVDLISNSIASMPIKLYKVKDGRVENCDDDPRVQLLNGDTGDTLNAFEMKKALVADYLMDGNGYAYIRKNRNDVTGLFYVDSGYVSVLINANPIFKERKLFVYANEYEIYEYIKLLRNTKDGAQGFGLTEEVNRALETAYKTLLYQLATVKRGGARKGFLKSQAKLSQEAIDKLKLAWRKLYEENSESVVVLNNGIEFQESSDSSVDMQLDQNKKTLTDEINNIFHIFPTDFHQTFKEAIYPIVRALESELNNTLLLEKEKKKYFFELDVKEIVRANIKERYEAYKLAKETGFMTINEIRRQENMEHIEGMDVINVGLAAVLYDTNTHKYYVPNKDAVTDVNSTSGSASEADGLNEAFDKKVEEDAMYDQMKAMGNIASLEERFNPNHDAKTGKFAAGHGGAGGGSGSGGSGDSEGSDGGASKSGSGGDGGSSEKSSSDAKNGGSKSGGESSSKSDYQDYTGRASWFEDDNPAITYKNNVKTVEQKEAISAYTSGNLNGVNYTEMNRYLNGKESFSGEKKDKYDNAIKEIDSTITNKLDKDVMVYRGTSIKPENLKVGTEITNKGFTSTSTDKDIATEFADFKEGSVIKIRAKKGTKALFVGNNSGAGYNEEELLFGRNTKIKIVENGANGIIGEIVYE